MSEQITDADRVVAAKCAHDGEWSVEGAEAVMAYRIQATQEAEADNAELRKWLSLALGVIKEGGLVWLGYDKAKSAVTAQGSGEDD